LKKFSLSLFCFFSIISFISAQHKAGVKPIPSWVDKISYDHYAPDIYKDSVEDGYYYPLRDYQVHVAKKTTFHHFVRKVISQKGVENHSEIKVDFDPAFEKLYFHEIKIIRNHEEINKLDVKKIKILNREEQRASHIYDGLLSALLILDDIRPQDIIEYSFSLEGVNPIFEGKYFDSFYIQYYDPSVRLYRSITVPKERKLTLRSFNNSEKPFVSETNTERKYKWDLSNVPGKHADNDSPSWYDPYPSIWVSEYESWKEVVDWATKLYSFSNEKPSPALLAKINQIQAMPVSKEEKLVEALRFVQDSIRYTGMEDGVWGVKPFSPNQVFKLRYGDCKGKSLLLCWILKQLDIIAYPALVNTSLRQKVNEVLPAPFDFDHCIITTTIGGKQYWYDATQTLQRGTYNQIYIANYKTALVLKPGNDGLTRMDVHTVSRTTVTEQFFLDSTGGGARMEVTTEYEGYDADANRSYFHNSSLKEVETNYLNYYSKTFPSIRSLALPNYKDEEMANIFITYEKYFIDSLWTVPDASKPIHIEASFYPEGLYDKIRASDAKNRTSPLSLEFPLEYEHIIELHAPERWDINPETEDIKGPGFVYRRLVRYYDNTVTIKHRLVTLKDHIEASDAKEYNRKMTKIREQLAYTIQHEKGTSVSSGNNNWPMMLVILAAFVGSFFICRKLYEYDPIPAMDVIPERNIGGWLIVFAIGLVISPVMLLYNTFITDDLFANRDLLTWLENNGQSVDMVTMIFNLSVLVTNILLISLSVLMLIVFFQRRSNAPAIVVIFFGYNIAILALNALVVFLLQVETTDEKWLQSLINVIIRAVIWILYFGLSKRVKRTFVVRRTNYER